MTGGVVAALDEFAGRRQDPADVHVHVLKNEQNLKIIWIETKSVPFQPTKSPNIQNLAFGMNDWTGDNDSSIISFILQENFNIYCMTRSIVHFYVGSIL